MQEATKRCRASAVTATSENLFDPNHPPREIITLRLGWRCLRSSRPAKLPPGVRGRSPSRHSPASCIKNVSQLAGGYVGDPQAVLSHPPRSQVGDEQGVI